MHSGREGPIASVAALCVAQGSQETQPGVLAGETGWEDDVVRTPPPSTLQLLMGPQSVAPEKS